MFTTDLGYTVQDCGGHDLGNAYYLPEIDISVWEDTQDADLRYYAWRGTFDDHDNATHTAVLLSFDAAVQACLDA